MWWMAMIFIHTVNSIHTMLLLTAKFIRIVIYRVNDIHNNIHSHCKCYSLSNVIHSNFIHIVNYPMICMDHMDHIVMDLIDNR